MVSKTNWKVAWVHLTSRKKQAAIAVLSVTFGVGLFIFMNSFVGGINYLQTELVFSSMAHIRVFNEVKGTPPSLLPDSGLVEVRSAKAIQYTEGIRNADRLRSLLEGHPELTGMTAQVNSSATFKNGAVKVGGVLSGVEVEEENRMFGMERYVVQGRWADLSYSSGNIAIGVGMAERLGVGLGGTLLATTAEGASRQFKVVALLFIGTPAVDNIKGFIRKASALQLGGKNRSYATDVQLNVRDFEQAQAVAEPIKALFPAYRVESWQEANEQLVSANALRNLIGTVVPLVLIIVAGFGIYNIMNMTVNEKIKEIAILKALGFGGGDVVEIFLSQAIVIGLAGGITGLGLGFSISKIVSRLPFKIASSEHLVILFEPRTYLLAFLIGVGITVLAGYLPARKAADVDPVQIIRG